MATSNLDVLSLIGDRVFELQTLCDYTCTDISDDHKRSLNNYAVIRIHGVLEACLKELANIVIRYHIQEGSGKEINASLLVEDFLYMRHRDKYPSFIAAKKFDIAFANRKSFDTYLISELNEALKKNHKPLMREIDPKHEFRNFEFTGMEKLFIGMGWSCKDISNISTKFDLYYKRRNIIAHGVEGNDEWASFTSEDLHEMKRCYIDIIYSAGISAVNSIDNLSLFCI